jgi:hypothetical protein
MSDMKVGGKHVSIWGIESSGHTLISSAVALEFARLVLQDHYGEKALASQSPLVIEAAADEWIVRGSAPHAVSRRYPTDPDELGQLEMRIARLDGQIRRLTFNISFPEAAEYARRVREGHPVDDMFPSTHDPTVADISAGDHKAD